MENNNQKTRVLAELRELAKGGQVSLEEVLAIFGRGKGEKHPSFSFQQLFYFIGGFIVILGVGILVGQAWDSWTQLMKTIFALGLSAFLYGLGYYFLYHSQKLFVFSLVSFILFVILLPLGLGTFFDLIGISAAGPTGQAMIFALLFIAYFASYWLFPEQIQGIFFIFSIIAASGLFITFTNLMIQAPSATFDKYRMLLLGVSYFLLAFYSLQRRFFVNLLYLAGSMAILGSTFALSLETAFWLFFYPLLLAGFFYLSVSLQSKVILFSAAVFTFSEIVRLTTKYFSDSLGWPLALIIAGIGIMVIGYLSLELNKRFLKK